MHVSQGDKIRCHVSSAQRAYLTLDTLLIDLFSASYSSVSNLFVKLSFSIKNFQTENYFIVEEWYDFTALRFHHLHFHIVAQASCCCLSSPRHIFPQFACTPMIYMFIFPSLFFQLNPIVILNVISIDICNILICYSWKNRVIPLLYLFLLYNQA